MSQRDRFIEWMSSHKLVIIGADANPEALVPWLNATVGSIKNARVSRIIELLQEERAVQTLSKSRTDAERQRLSRLITSGSKSPFELNELLLRYRVSPRLMFVEDGPCIVYFSTKKARGRIAIGEIGAVMAVMHLGLRDELDRVRKCHCETYFFARRIDQIYCSPECRVRYHQSSAEFRAKRRKYQQEWYHLKKSGKVK
jgi:hypothetical protein